MFQQRHGSPQMDKKLNETYQSDHLAYKLLRQTTSENHHFSSSDHFTLEITVFRCRFVHERPETQFDGELAPPRQVDDVRGSIRAYQLALNGDLINWSRPSQIQVSAHLRIVNDLLTLTVRERSWTDTEIGSVVLAPRNGRRQRFGEVEIGQHGSFGLTDAFTDRG